MAVRHKVKTIKHKCPPHHFIINSQNVGHCKYCPVVKDFGEILTRNGVFVAAGRRGAKARILGEKSAARIAAATKRWQDPEYRAKQSAALEGRQHKKKKEAIL